MAGQTLKTALKDAYIVFHVASPPPELDDRFVLSFQLTLWMSQTPMELLRFSRTLFLNVNVKGTKTVIQACKEAKVQVSCDFRLILQVCVKSPMQYLNDSAWSSPAAAVSSTRVWTLRTLTKILHMPTSPLTHTQSPRFFRSRKFSRPTTARIS